MAKKLRCDRCGFELTDKDSIDLAYAGMSAWQTSARARGIKPRGVLPCKNYIRCGGEIVKLKWFPPHSKDDYLTGIKYIIKSILSLPVFILIFSWLIILIIIIIRLIN
ncbi:MAG TPA: hypothetical protein G4O18_03785 [Dehalococcoidia bacterium]|nr:hypothetical protein [Dehalococcoidia bacterium]